MAGRVLKQSPPPFPKTNTNTMDALDRAKEVFNLMKQKEDIDIRIVALMRGGGEVEGKSPGKKRKQRTGERVAPQKPQSVDEPGAQEGGKPCCGSKGKRHKKGCPREGVSARDSEMHHYECMDCGKEFSDEFGIDMVECPLDPNHHVTEK